MKPDDSEIVKADVIMTRAICWACGKRLHGYSTATLNPKTGELFCDVYCQVAYKE